MPAVMRAPTAEQTWLGLGLTGAILVAVSMILTAWLDLHPCHLCIFQRLLFMLLAVLSLAAAFPVTGRAGRLAGVLSLPTAALGVGVAAYQSWLQAQPSNSISCAGGEPGLIERLVEWLGEQAPVLFLATGFCEEEELVILGLSLANWALVAYFAFLAAGLWALLKAPHQNRLHHGGHP